MADVSSALRKLTSGQSLTDAEKKLLGISVNPTKATLTQAEIDAKTAEQVAAGIKSTSKEAKLEGETYAEANARLIAGYKTQPKPELTVEGKTAGATIEFVRTGAGGVGEYREVFPIGTPIPTQRTTAFGNVYDAQGNLISGTGLKTSGTGTLTIVSEVENPDGTKTITYSDGSKKTLPKTTVATTITEVSRVTNADGSTTITYSDGSKKVIPKAVNSNTSVVTGTTYTGSGTTTDPFKLNGTNFTGVLGGVNYVNGIKEDTAKKTAQQEFRASLADFGLGDLADVVDGFIRNDYSVSQIKLELPKTQSYKDRFPGMEALRAAGQAVNEATYISMERGYLQTLQAYGLDTKVLGSRKQLGTYVANLVSPREFEERVNLAATRVKDNADVISQFKVYYPEVDNSALTAYLLNPTVGMDIIKKQVRLAEIGAAAMDVGFATGVSLSTAEELRGAVGEQDYQTIKSAFGQAKVLSDQQARLARIEGTNYSQNEAIQGIVGKDIQSQLASQKRAERETMTRFGGRSGVTSTSLRSETEI